MLIVKEDIISRINNGDAKAFEQLYTTFYVYLCAVATKYVYNSEAAREIVNDVFIYPATSPLAIQYIPQSEINAYPGTLTQNP